MLEDYQLSAFELYEMPARTDTGSGKIGQPFTELSSERVQDARGDHLYLLTELNEWAVSLVAKLTDDQVEHFCRRWSESEIYTPFQGWEGVAPEVALQRVREDAYKKLYEFVACFRPFCRDARATRKGVFLLREWHGDANLGIGEVITTPVDQSPLLPGTCGGHGCGVPETKTKSAKD